MATPPGGSLDAFDSWADEQVGAPRATWPVYEVGPGQEYPDTAAVVIPSGGLAVVRVHWRPEAYPALKIKGKRAVEVIGIPGPDGELPEIEAVNATRSHHDGEPVLPGGLIVRGVRTHNIGVPNNQQFVVVDDSILERCQGHCMITAPSAHHLYVRVMDSELRQAGSHVLYVDRAARADIIGNTCESPGWGHCIRSVAHYSHVEGNVASNVQLDGTVIQKWDKPDGTCSDPPIKGEQCAIGMHPLEVYQCADGIVRNNVAIKWQDNQALGVILMRGRTDIGYCDTEGKTADGEEWIQLEVTDPRFLHEGLWDLVNADLDASGNQSRYAFNLVFEGNTTKTIGPNPRDGLGYVLNSGWPSHDPPSRTLLKEAMKAFVSTNAGKSCEDLAALAPTSEMRWLFEHAQPTNDAVCRTGALPEYIPRPAPDNWRDRQWVTWGEGNEALLCAGGLDSCAPTTGCAVRKDDKMRAFWHPGDPVTNSINFGELRECLESGEEE
jgi:hypothetical protein